MVGFFFFFLEFESLHGIIGKSKRRLSLGEYRRAVSWSKYLASSGAEMREREPRWQPLQHFQSTCTPQDIRSPMHMH